MKALILSLVISLGLNATAALAMDDRVVTAKPYDGESMRYVLTSEGKSPKYAVILMPGGNGRLGLPATDVPVGLKLSDNFLIRTRRMFVDPQFVAASMASTSTPGKIMTVVADLESRYGKLKVYVVGTSNSTNATLSLADTLDGQVAGFVHTSSFNRISGFDPRTKKSRNLIVLHEQDACQFTKPSGGLASHRSYGTDLIEMTGGKTMGDECEAWAHHGYNGVEKETVDKIKAWILAGG